MVLANRTTGALFGCLLSVPAFAGSEQFRAPASSGLPLGSFESAGVAVFVRAHEARRQLIAPVASDARPLAYAPVPDRVPIDASGQAAEFEIDMPRTTGGTARTRWVAPADQPRHPGALVRDPLDAAGPFGKSGLLDLHPTPDLEIEVSKRTTLGVFGEANTIEPTDIRNSTMRSTRDLGAGVTLQYRFGE